MHIRVHNGRRAARQAENGHFARECAMALDTLHANVHIGARSVQQRADAGVSIAHSRSKRPDFPDSDARWPKQTRDCTFAFKTARFRVSIYALSPAAVRYPIRMGKQSTFDVLIVNGSPCGVSAGLLRDLAARSERVVAVDSGVRWVLDAGLVPDLHIGDMDHSVIVFIFLDFNLNVLIGIGICGNRSLRALCL